MGEVALRKIQAGIETVRGTDIASTRKVYGSGKMTKSIAHIRPDEDRGTFIKNYRSSLGIVEAAFPVDGGCSFEDLAWWFQLALKGGVVGAVRGVTAYDYVFTPSSTVDDVKSATFEWGDETQAFQMNYGMVESFEIDGSLNSNWKFTANVVGADMATTTFTGAIGDRTVEDISTYLTKLAIGPTGAVPATYMTGRFIGFKISIKNAFTRKYFADGTSPALGGMGRGKREISSEVTFEGNAATIAERGVWEAGTKRVARITATGTAITGSTGPILKTVDIVLPGMWDSYEIGDRDTNTVFVGTLMSEYDVALAHDFSATVTNGLATLP